MESSDDEPLWPPTPPPTQPVFGILPTWVGSGGSHVMVSGRNVRPRVRVRSVPTTIVDDVEGDLEVSAVSTVPASSRALHRLRLVSGRARDEPTESSSQMPSFM